MYIFPPKLCNNFLKITQIFQQNMPRYKKKSTIKTITL